MGDGGKPGKKIGEAMSFIWPTIWDLFLTIACFGITSVSSPSNCFVCVLLTKSVRLEKLLYDIW